MFRMNHSKWGGFTIMEILIAGAIIVLVATIALVSYNEARKEARDRKRISDIEQFQLALKLYSETYGELPCSDASKCSSSLQTASADGEVGVGGHIDTLIAPFMADVPMDPKGPGATYRYYYKGRHMCNDDSTPQTDRYAMIWAQTMETGPYHDQLIHAPVPNSNYENTDYDNCHMGTGGSPDNETYVIILGPSTDDL